MMIMAVNTIKIKKGRADEVLARFAQPKAVHTYEGFVWMEVLKSLNEEEYDEIKVCTTWESEDAFQNWANSRATRKMHDESPTAKKQQEDSPMLGAKLTKFEVVHRHAPASKE